ncbi:hypothetical protein TorRG33x02_087990 [Trema orientale]|uniref:Uncharacterized protein n=1 Tax=Trema orientale TaxID=63057 RepID=A0A2P5FBV5_TREOI|nr:hypothetical protein TorRG33x02_087990 [Trema orientale]
MAPFQTQFNPANTPPPPSSTNSLAPSSEEKSLTDFKSFSKPSNQPVIVVKVDLISISKGSAGNRARISSFTSSPHPPFSVFSIPLQQEPFKYQFELWKPRSHLPSKFSFSERSMKYPFEQ